MKNIQTMVICQHYSNCYRVKRDDGSWVKFIMAPMPDPTEIRISHGICPECEASTRALYGLRFKAPQPTEADFAPREETLLEKCDRLERINAMHREALLELKEVFDELSQDIAVKLQTDC